jgi:predicted small lipoprotein YifL
MARRGIHLVAACAAALLVSGCGAEGPPSDPPAASAAGGEPMHEHEHPPVPAAPTDVPADQALDVAEAALRAYASPHLRYPDWWAGLAPHLSPAGQTAYAETDPAEVPARELLGPPALEPQVSPWLAAVTIDTDAGFYRIRLSRADDGRWQVDRFELLASHG